MLNYKTAPRPVKDYAGFIGCHSVSLGVNFNPKAKIHQKATLFSLKIPPNKCRYGQKARSLSLSKRACRSEPVEVTNAVFSKVVAVTEPVEVTATTGNDFIDILHQKTSQIMTPLLFPIGRNSVCPEITTNSIP